MSDLRERGLRPPLLGVTDGSPALISAFEQVFPQALRQRCAIHVARNLLDKVSKAHQDQVKVDYWAVFNDIEAPPGEAAIAVVEQRARAFEAKWGSTYPKAVDCLVENLSALTAHLHFPVEHREQVRHSNLLERTFGESRRRVKVIGRLPGEHSCLSLVWAVLDRLKAGRRPQSRSPAGDRRRLPPARS
jgi:putative transposase